MTWWLKYPPARCDCGADADPMIGLCYGCYSAVRSDAEPTVEDLCGATGHEPYGPDGCYCGTRSRAGTSPEGKR